jgi:hypothetical protein
VRLIATRASYRMTARRLPDRVRSKAVIAIEGKPKMSNTSGSLVYWNAHTGFGEIELDSEPGRVGIYRADFLKAGVKAPRVGDRFHVSTDVANEVPNNRWSRFFDFRRRDQ